MRILFYGDSITDAGRNYEQKIFNDMYGTGYVFNVASNLLLENPEKYEILNKGISGNRIVDLYQRVKIDLWNNNPDVLSILIGVNDVWHEIIHNNGVELDRFEKIYRMLIEETMQRLPNIKIMLLEPFVLKGWATNERFDEFLQVYDYAKVVKKLAEEYNLIFVPLQEKFNEMAKVHDPSLFLVDGVHPNMAGAKLICDEWLKVFKEKVDV